jgi:hypothetical protein
MVTSTTGHPALRPQGQSGMLHDIGIEQNTVCLDVRRNAPNSGPISVLLSRVLLEPGDSRICGIQMMPGRWEAYMPYLGEC